jgi:hypothetical protein
MSSTAILSSAIVISLRVVGSSVQRREDDAMANPSVSRFGCYTIIWDTTDSAGSAGSRHAAWQPSSSDQTGEAFSPRGPGRLWSSC